MPTKNVEIQHGMMQAIQTRFLPATHNRGARVKATTESGASVTVPYDYEGTDASHAKAVRELCTKLGWHGTLVSGGTRHGMVFVFVPGVPTHATT